MQARYIIITAAKNEEAYIGEAIQSVVQQSHLPHAWLIMDDGSTDRTARIVAGFAAQHPFIQLHSAGDGQGRNFGSQYKAIQAAYEKVKGREFEFLGVQDADIAFQGKDYYRTILEKFRQDPRLGIAGGYIYERANGNWQSRKGNSRDSVAGGIQLFRRECFEQIGGYTPLYLGGSDWLAQLDAGMAGWKVLACPELPAHHYRPTSSANGSLRGWFQLGLLDGSFGSHPLFEVFKCARRFSSRPYVVGSALRLLGYAWWNCSGRKAVIPREKAIYLRRQQLAKVSAWLKGTSVAAPAAPLTHSAV